MPTTDFTHQAFAVDNQFVNILYGIEAANIFGEIVMWSLILNHQVTCI